MKELKNLEESLGKLVVENVNEKPKKMVKQSEKVHKCGKCGNVMKYISDFKKHLECGFCSSVKRNYK